MMRTALAVLATVAISGHAFAQTATSPFASPTSPQVDAPRSDQMGTAAVSNNETQTMDAVSAPYVLGRRHYAMNGSILTAPHEQKGQSKDEWDATCSAQHGSKHGTNMGFCVIDTDN